MLDLLIAAISFFFSAVWELLKACRHSLDEECFAIQEKAKMTRLVLGECPETVTITTIGLVMPRWLYEWGYLVLVATVMGSMLWFKIDIGRVMPGRRQGMINAINAPNGVGI